ncbi:hypothetical protein ACFWBC_10395 [Streptomyces sp. NPDC059985]|uniref:ATP-dependent DNA ligase n=1 Tax=Streptomyces sp. NPDC059985 TaxID=3347025 RepID=UPI00368C668F
MEFPVEVALAQAVPELPTGPGWWFEGKFDGHRMVLRRGAESVDLYTRAGRIVTSVWMDLAVAGLQLRPGTVLDGEAVIWRNGRIDFGAAQARASSSLTRARALARELPATYAIFDLLAHPDHGDVRGRSYEARRELLVELVGALGPPLQVVPATDDREVAMVWFEVLQAQGIEGLVAKRASGTYRGGRRDWRKVRHAETSDARVVGYAGTSARPGHLLLELTDGRRIRSQRVTGTLAAQIARAAAAAGPGTRIRTDDGETYTTYEGAPLLVEVLAGTSRHAVVTVTRLR